MHHHRLRRPLAGLALLAVGALLVGCAGGPAADPADSDAASGGERGGKDSITIVHAPINYEVAYIAEREGYFDELGLDVTITPGGPPQDNIAQIMGGSADLTIGSWDTIVTSTAEGMPLLAVASAGVVSSTVDTSGIIVRADSGIETVAGLEGKTIAFNDLGGGPHIVTIQSFEKAGLTEAAFEAVRIPFASMQATLESGQVDAVFPSDSFYEQMIALDDYRVIANPTREFRAGLPITIWTATEQWLAENPGTADRFIEAMERATAFYEDPANHEAVLQIRQDVGGMSAEQAEAMKGEFAVAIPLGVTQSVTEALISTGAIEDNGQIKTSEELVWEDSPTTE
ncbi:MAG: ABC transporter substrate-binding protein [Microbacteriaceae bacterium]|nr:ABC transporter substrate-binding protein [Microbacteriaceae bacterium]